MYPINKTIGFTAMNSSFYIETSMPISNGARTISFDHLIKGDDYFSEMSELHNQKRNRERDMPFGMSLDEKVDKYIEEHALCARENNSISSLRIHNGMKKGLIDLTTEALIKTKHGWKTHSGDIIADLNATYDQLVKVSERYTTVLPTITRKDLDNFNREGKVVIGDKIVAERLSSGEYSDEWYIHSQNRCLSGDAERVLHHQDEPCYYTTTSHDLDNSLYHGSLYKSSEIDSISLDEPLRRTFGASSPGDGIYLAGLNEAVKVYANGISPERQSLKEWVVANTDPDYTNEGRNGVVFKARLADDISLYDADYNSGTSVLTTSDKPSPYVFLAILNNSDTEHQPMKKARAISEISCAENPFEVYRAIERFASEVEVSKDSSKIIPMVFASMGYDAVRVSPPQKHQIDKMREIEKLIRDNPDKFESELSSRVTGNPKSIINSFLNYSNSLLSGVSGRIDKHHVIVFRDESERNGVEFVDFLALPEHSYFKDRGFEKIQNDPVFSPVNAKNYDKWSLSRLSKYVDKIERKELGDDISPII